MSMLEQFHATCGSSGLSDALKKEIADEFWNIPQGQDISHLEWYFKYYAQQVISLALHNGGDHVSAKSHHDIVEIVRYLKRDQERGHIPLRLPTPKTERTSGLRDPSIDLAARLLLMVQLGETPGTHSIANKLNWGNTTTLREFVAGHFKAGRILDHRRIKLDRHFTGNKLNCYAGIKITWTDNLADHLRLVKDGAGVEIFNHVGFLKTQQQYNRESLFPKPLIDETLKTLVLLFPVKSHGSVREWYKKKAEKQGLDTGLLELGPLDEEEKKIERFEYWHDRLVTLKEEYDNARPRNLLKIWRDRRQGHLWWTFWVAILIVVCTVITIGVAVADLVFNIRNFQKPNN